MNTKNQGSEPVQAGTSATPTPHTSLYLRADEVKPGDILPDVSRSPVSHVIVDPRSHVTFRFTGTELTRTARYGGPEYGYECFYVLRAV